MPRAPLSAAVAILIAWPAAAQSDKPVYLMGEDIYRECRAYAQEKRALYVSAIEKNAIVLRAPPITTPEGVIIATTDGLCSQFANADLRDAWTVEWIHRNRDALRTIKAHRK